ncbi:hypothetical protein PLEOSDRAFT_154797 [Pleurotus ostreatus PC15]|uniref:Uncharacterized protein n=1 Tax=Pleurotus ostreatus (strain PC15) TaxID=1137138 RepID=A0A067NQ79_PLEO1|nr:hypothetical protein PLEOSDRAFT_154797 [Pleurotus ostreatus PC15]
MAGKDKTLGTIGSEEYLDEDGLVGIGPFARLETQVKQGLVFHTLDDVSWSNYPDYSGAHLERNPTRPSDRFLTAFADQMPEVPFLDMSPRDDVDRRALFQRLDEGPEQWETFDLYLAERLTEVGRLMSFIEMFNFPTADQGTRDASFESGLILAADTLNSINLEQRIESTTSLESVSSFNMIWEDIDAAFQLEHQGSPDSSDTLPTIVGSSNSYNLRRDVRGDILVAFVGVYRLQRRTAPQPDTEPKPIELPVFLVSKQVYDTLEKLSKKDEKGQLNPLTHIGFEFNGRRSGSRAVFKPQRKRDFRFPANELLIIDRVQKNTTDCVHLPHVWPSIKYLKLKCVGFRITLSPAGSHTQRRDNLHSESSQFLGVVASPSANILSKFQACRLTSAKQTMVWIISPPLDYSGDVGGRT